MNNRRRPRGRALIAFALTLTMLSTLLVLVAGPTSGVVQAIPAPTGPLPACVVSSTGSLGLGCAPGEMKGVASGTFASGSSFSIDADEVGPSACADYVSTGCYYEVFSPSILRCVYLFDNDPTDVRSCSSLSASSFVGSSTAQRQGSCRGELGSTYALGGPANGNPSTWWINRGPVVANCEYRVSDTIEIDNLGGPTFFLVAASVDECIIAPGHGCDESSAVLERRTGYGWLPVEGTLAPRAAFTPEQLGNSLAFNMDNQSIPFDGPTTYEWYFGDGSPVVASENPSHTFETLGSYRVRLTMRGSEVGETRTAYEWVDIEAPDLSIIITNPNAEFGPGKDGNRFDLGDEVDLRIVVTATDGVGDLREAAPTVELLTLPEQFELVNEPVEVTPRTFDVGDQAEFNVRVRAVKAGPVAIRSTWNGTGIDNRLAGPWTGTLNAKVTGLKVTIEPDPNSFKIEDTNDDGDIDEDDENFVDVDVTVENVTDQSITDVQKGTIVVTSMTDDNFVQFTPLESPADDPGTPAVDEGEFGDLAPGATKTLRWRYRADEALQVRLTTLVTGNGAGETLTGFGEAEVKALDIVLIEARIDVVQGQAFRSGAPVRISGNFTNVTDQGDEPETVSFAVSPEFTNVFDGDTELNGAAGFFGPVGGASAIGVERYELAPGASIDLTAIVQTVTAPVASGFRVEYSATAAIKNVAEGGIVSWEPQGEIAVDIIAEQGFSARHDVTVGRIAAEELEDPNFISCDDELLYAAEYIGCKLLRGVETAVRGFGGLAQIGWKLATAPAAAYGWYLGTTFAFLEASPEGRAAIVVDVVADLQALAEKGHEVLSGISSEDIALLVPRLIDTSITRLADAWDTGAERFFGELAEIAGENIDMVFEVLVAARAVARVSKAVTTGNSPLRTRLRQEWDARRAKGLAEIDALIATKGYRAVPGSRLLPGGVDVTDLPKIWKASFGLSADNFRVLRNITEEYGVNVVFRSRAPKSISLIENNIALPKPQGIKAKGVNEIDMDFLDYPRKYDSKVVHMEPPIAFSPDEAVLQQRARDYADTVLAERRSGMAKGSPEYEDLAAQIQARVKTRTEEWVKRSKDYEAALTPNPLTGKPVGVKVDFDPDFNGLDEGALQYVPNSQIELVPQGKVNGRELFEVKLEAPPGHPGGPDGERFLDITGDIDFLAILKPDGTVLGANGNLAELRKRAEIYEAMRSLVGMQHGESFTIFNKKELRAEYLREGLDSKGGETLLAVTPQQRIITTYFDDGLSTLKGGPSSQLGELQQARAFFSGIFSELKSPSRPWSTILLDELAAARRRLISRLPNVFNLNILRDLIAGYGETTAEVSHDGAVLRPDGVGGTEQYVADTESGNQFAGSKQPVSETRAQSATGDPLTDLRAIIADLESQGADFSVPPGALGGRWVPVDISADVSAGQLSIAPFGFLMSTVEAGQNNLDLTDRGKLSLDAGSDYFAVGDEIVLDPGGLFEERATIVTMSPVTLAAPVRYMHSELTSVVLHPGTARPDPGPGPGPGPDPVDPDPVDPVVPFEGALNPLTPARVFETRSGEVTVDGEFEGVGRLKAGSVTPVQVAGRGGVAVGAAAVAVNVTAIRPSGVGFVTLFPCGADQPLTSSLNYGAGGVAGNSGIVKLSAAGELCVFAQADTDLVLDVNAWLAEVPSFESLTPARLVETRAGEVTVDGEEQELGRLEAGSVTEVQIAGRGGVSSDADAVALNVTAIRPAGVGYVTLYPCDEDRPTTSSLNYAAGGAVGNSAVVSLAGDGKLCVFTFAETDLVLDVNAWLADDASFDPLVPARFFETRSGEETIDGDGNGVGRLDALSVIPIQIAGRGDVPDGASAVALNVTAVRPAGVGYITLFPCDGDQPLTSSLNYVAGGAVGNSGVVKLAADGTVCAYTQAETDLVIDVNAAWTN